jgi:tRNA (guanine-N7-)-methyltransferase
MRRKAKKQLEVRTLPNVLWGNTAEIKTRLLSRFSDTQRFTLELGCGNGEYTLSLAEKNPERFFIGIDVKGSRIWKGAKYALEKQINNCLFIITRIDRLHLIFQQQTVEEIWIPFPNPFPMRKSIKQRLVHKRFIDVYRFICVPQTKIHLKTDDETLFNYAIQVADEEKLTLISAVDDLYNSPLHQNELKITTKFEQQHISNNKTIKYVCLMI